MRMMGAESVKYHRATVLGRADDYPGMAMAYYASRGETPLAWGGSGAGALGLSGPVTAGAYDAVFGVGGARDPGLLSRRGPSGAHQGPIRGSADGTFWLGPRWLVSMARSPAPKPRWHS